MLINIFTYDKIEKALKKELNNMIEETKEGKTNYCKHENTNESGICDMCLGKEDTNTLREEQNLFKEWLNSGATNFPEDSYDWWLNKFNQKLEEIEREIEKGRKEIMKYYKTYDNTEMAVNQTLDLALQIIKNKKI